MQDEKFGVTVGIGPSSVPPMRWWERLSKIIEARDLLDEQVAKDARVPVKSLYGYLKGEVDNPRGDVVQRLARAVQTSEQALRYGDTPAHVPLRRVPLLDMSKLGTLKANQDPLSVWDGISYATVPGDVRDGAFAVALTDNSGEPEFQEGDLIICDPAADVVPGRYVLTIATDDKATHFGRYRPTAHGDRRNFKIKPRNEDYPEVEIGGKTKGFILGRAIKHIRNI